MKFTNQNNLQINTNIYPLIRNKILPLVLPLISSQSISIIGGFLCVMMVSKLGDDILAASTLIISIQESALVIIMTIFSSLSILVGQKFGNGKYSSIGNLFQQGWILGILMALPLMILFWNISDILIFLGQSKHIAEIVDEFFKAHTLRIIPLMMSACNQQLCYGIRAPKIDIIGNICGLILLIIVSYILIFGKLGFPELGIKGLGYAMVVQTWFYFLLTSLYFYFKKSFKCFNLFNYKNHKNWDYLIKIFKTGWPISLQMSLKMFCFPLYATMMGWVGNYALASYQILIQYLFLMAIPLFALSQSAGILVSQLSGNKMYDEIKKLGEIFLVLTLIISLLFSLLLIFFSTTWISIFIDINNPLYKKTINLILILFFISSLSQIFDSLRTVVIGLLRGFFDIKFSMIVGLLSIFFIAIPLSYFLGIVLKLGAVGIIIGSAIEMFIGAWIVFLRWRIIIIHKIQNTA